MILVLSCNPAIDRRAKVDRLVRGRVIRADACAEKAGGKGVNVAFAAAELGREVRLVGFSAGRRGELLRDQVMRRGIEATWIEVPGETRICLAVVENGVMTEILEPGPRIPPKAAKRAIEELTALASKARVVVISGSLPDGLANSFYARAIQPCRGSFVLIDASGPALVAALSAMPDMVRINADELRSAMGAKDIRKGMRSIARRGIVSVIVSDGPRGASFLHSGRFGRIAVPRLRALNAIGAGDCMAAGIAAAIDAGRPIEEALRLGGACGAAKVLVEETGTVRRRDIERMKRRVEVRWG